MPYKSDAQRRFMHAKHPRIAKRWDKHTPKGKKLPEKVKKEKDAFVQALVQAVYEQAAARGISKEAFAKTVFASRLVKMAKLTKTATSAVELMHPESVGSNVNAAAVKVLNLLGMGDPAVRRNFGGGALLGGLLAGGAGGMALAKLTGPSSKLVENLQKEELLARYDAAIGDINRRIEARQIRG